ncbi:MAG: ABC transporter permease [Sphaerochaetaceae bacterium]|nr:ABC transporter permease [Sphaerochaetaceae bacterium]MDD4219710.1 ABC transporter permease [Sphaerochaetaceae bacterium]
MNQFFGNILTPQFGYSVIRVTTPLLLPALGVAISELSGAANIALEGIMLIAAFTGVVVSAYTGSLWLAFIAGIAAGVLVGALLGFFHLRLKADIILSAIALNMFASGITIFLLFLLTGDKGSSNSLQSLIFPEFKIPLLHAIPVIGEIFSGHNLLTYLSVVAIFFYWILVKKTPLGLRIRAVGQNPHAAESVGINVNKIRLYALMLSGMFGALGGMYLSMGYVSWFSRDMTAGRGFIAIAASTLGNLTPLGIFLSSLLFGFVNAVSIYISSLNIPSEIIQSIPYVMTVLALTFFSMRKKRDTL